MRQFKIPPFNVQKVKYTPHLLEIQGIIPLINDKV